MNDAYAIELRSKDLQKRLEFVMLLVLFFPVLFDALSNLSKAGSSSDSMVLTWGLVIGSLVVDYLLIEYVKRTMFEQVAKWVDRFLLTEIALFVPTLFVIGVVQDKQISYTYLLPLGAVTISLMLIPTIALCLLVYNAAYPHIQEIKRDLIEIYHWMKGPVIKFLKSIRQRIPPHNTKLEKE